MKKLAGLLTRRERRQALFVLGLMIAIAAFEMVGVASITPFIAVLANPGVIQSNAMLRTVYELLGFTSQQHFLLFLGAGVFALLITSLALKAAGAWSQLRFSELRNHEWACKLVKGYLGQPYEWFLNRHSADLASRVLTEVNQVVNNALVPALQVISQFLVSVFLLTLLIAVDPLLAVISGLVLGASYGIVFASLRKRLSRVGLERRANHTNRFYVVNEAFGGVKEVKVAGLEAVYVSRFQKESSELTRRQIIAGVITQLPSFVMQGLLFGGMLLIILYLMINYGGFQQALPVVALYAFAGYRLMPALQTLYQQASQLRVSEANVDALVAELEQFSDEAVIETASAVVSGGGLRLRSELVLNGVGYSYPNASRPSLQDVSIVVPAMQTIGLVGSTGSGKTTTIDVLLGLLRPETGALIVDGVTVDDENRRAWQKSVGYVPQQVFLIDESIEQNIAMGVPLQEIDRERVIRVATIANLHDFVINELPDGYASRVGERGVRLSGGQRQRIGIARALYREPDLLVMDEGTSALDNLTERAVMESLQKLKRLKTIVLVAHRLTTVRNCDRIYVMDRGRVSGSGKYEELLDQNEKFRALAHAGDADQETSAESV